MRSSMLNAIKIAFALYGFVALVWALGGFAILATIFSVGGSPGLGKIERGHYFVGNHGHYTEVSAAFFNRFVKVISWEEFLGLLLGLIAAPILMLVYLKRAWDLAREEYFGRTRDAPCKLGRLTGHTSAAHAMNFKTEESRH